MKRLVQRTTKHFISLTPYDAHKPWIHGFLQKVQSKRDMIRALRQQHRVSLHNTGCAVFEQAPSKTTSSASIVLSAMQVRRLKYHRIGAQTRINNPPEVLRQVETSLAKQASAKAWISAPVPLYQTILSLISTKYLIPCSLSGNVFVHKNPGSAWERTISLRSKILWSSLHTWLHPPSNCTETWILQQIFQKK